MNLQADSPIFLKINALYPSFTPSQKKVADYLLKNPEVFIYGNLTTASKDAGVSEASFVRFSKLLGYSGYRDMHIDIAMGHHMPQDEGIDELNIDSNTHVQDIPQRVIGNSVHALNNLMETLDLHEFSSAVEALEKARTIHVFGIGNSALAGQDIVQKFTRLGKNVLMVTDPHLQVVNTLSLTKKDVAIGISHSGRTPQTIDPLRLAKEQGATVIGITNFIPSAIAAIADITLQTASTEKVLQSETMISLLSQLAITDMLYLGVLCKNYDQYAQLIEKQNNAVVSMFFKK